MRELATHGGFANSNRSPNIVDCLQQVATSAVRFARMESSGWQIQSAPTVPYRGLAALHARR